MKWGIIGYGQFAPSFLASLEEIETEEVTAIATRSGVDRARKDYPSAIIYSDYALLYQDEEIEIVYVATTHDTHKDHVLKALEYGKHVICEKPMSLTEADTIEMIHQARNRGLFLMEGLWIRYLPIYRKMMNEITQGTIGSPKTLTANFCFEQTSGNESRLLNRKLGGGALYDLGIYQISYATDIFKSAPTNIFSTTQMTETGVDGIVNTMLEFEDGGVAHLFCSILMNSDRKLIVYGTKGRIEMNLDGKMESYTVIKDGQIREEKASFISTGYFHEIEHAIASIKSHKISPKWFSHEDSILNAKIVDLIKNIWEKSALIN